MHLNLTFLYQNQCRFHTTMLTLTCLKNSDILLTVT
jgi:hypothetical protein